MNRVLVRAQEIARRHIEAVGPKPLFALAESKTEASLYIYEIIGEDWWTGGGVTAKGVVGALAQMNGVKTLNIYINSPGGDVFEAKAIYANLKRFNAEKVVHIDGIAASAATLIAMAGDRIISQPAATWMVHEPWTVAGGPADDLRAVAEMLDRECLAMGETYAERTGRSVEDVLAVMKAETWMSAKEALDGKFTDEIAGQSKDDDKGETAPAAKASALEAASAHTQKIISMGLARARVQNHSRRASPALRSGQP